MFCESFEDSDARGVRKLWKETHRRFDDIGVCRLCGAANVRRFQQRERIEQVQRVNGGVRRGRANMRAYLCRCFCMGICGEFFEEQTRRGIAMPDVRVRKERDE